MIDTPLCVVRPLSAPPIWDNPPDNGHTARALRFFMQCPNTKAESGVVMGDTWLDWQDRLTRIVFGLVDEDGIRLIQEVYAEMPKKTAKSHWAAAAGLYSMALDGVMGGEVYSAGFHEKQAKVTWEIAMNMIYQDERLGLSQQFDVREYVNEIRHRGTGSVWTPLSRGETGKSGFNPSLAIFDELHEHQSDAMLTTCKDSMGARRQPLLIEITNAGVDRESVCYRQREYAMKVNSGLVEAPSFLGVIYGTEDAETWQEPETWRSAHPGLGVTVSEKWMAERCQKAAAIPAEVAKVLRWQLGIWTGAESRYIPMDDWNACAGEVNEAALIGRPCYSGLDLASKEDIAALVHLFPMDDGTHHIIVRAWIPAEAIERRSRDHGVPYDAWLRDGLVYATPGSWIDYSFIEKTIRDDAERFDIREIAYDRWGADQLVQRLGPDGEGVATFVGVGQGFKDMSEPTKELLGMVLRRKIAHGGNLLLSWCCDNMMVRMDPAGNVKPDKKASTEKIDPMVALALAVDRFIRHERAPTHSWLVAH